MEQRSRFVDKVAVVTGATRGIGRAIAREFVLEGARVVIVGRSTPDRPHGSFSGTLVDAEAELRALGGDVLAVQADVSVDDDIEQITEATMQRFGRCDVLVNNAAVAYVGPFTDLSAKRVDIILDVNLRGPLMLMRALLPHMEKAGHGHVVNISSGAARILPPVDAPGASEALRDATPARGGAHMNVYGTSKAALNRLTVGLAHEYAGVVSFNALDVAAVTEIYRLDMVDTDWSQLERAEAPAQIVTWIAAQPISFSGHLLDQDSLLPGLRASGEVRPKIDPTPADAGVRDELR